MECCLGLFGLGCECARVCVYMFLCNMQTARSTVVVVVDLPSHSAAHPFSPICHPCFFYPPHPPTPFDLCNRLSLATSNNLPASAHTTALHRHPLATPISSPLCFVRCWCRLIIVVIRLKIHRSIAVTGKRTVFSVCVYTVYINVSSGGVLSKLKPHFPRSLCCFLVKPERSHHWSLGGREELCVSLPSAVI